MSIKDTALSLIEKHGQEIKIIRKVGGSVDPVTGSRSSETEQEFYPYGLSISDKKSIGKYFSSVSGDEKVYMMDASITYKNGDKALIGSDVLAINEIATESQKGVPVYYMVKLVK
mgnify:CR=1 FL=1